VEYYYEFGGQQLVVQVEASGDGYRVTVAGRTYQVHATLVRPGVLDLQLEGERRGLAYVAVDGARRWVVLGASAGFGSSDTAGQTYVLVVPDPRRRPRRAQAVGPAALEAQMPGLVRAVLVAAGQPVARGQALILLEAMKMEIRVTAPEAGVVRRVVVTAGQAVERGQALLELEPAPDPPA
jgi:biotin carboxyl carrier protein